MRGGLWILTLGAVLAFSTPAFADATADAVKAFDEGRKLRDEGYYNAAIKQFERSLQLAPSIGANYNLGFCYEQMDRLGDALIAYRQAVAIAQDRNDPRLADANDAVRKLLAAHAHILLVTSPAVAATGGLSVRVDDLLVPARELNGEVFREGKLHTIVVSVPGHTNVVTTIASGETFNVTPGQPGPPGPSGTEPADRPWQRWTGLGLAAAGVVTAGVGVVVAVGYFSDREDLQAEAKATCSTKVCQRADGTKTPEGESLQRRAEDLDSSALTRNLIVFGVAGVLIAGGAVLFVTAPPSKAARAREGARVRLVPQVGAREQGLTLVGTF